MLRVHGGRSAEPHAGLGVVPAASSEPAPVLQLDRAGRVAALVAVAVAYYLGARFGLSLSLVKENVTPLWPPTGIAVAASSSSRGSSR